MNKQLAKTFKSPGSEFRGAPFWAWNGKLDPEELRRQIRVMDRMGLGGFFMHSRVGLDTAYLSDEWFECVDACIDEAEKLDMQAWLYDEDRWPSGAAGGLVTKDPRYRARKLACDTLRKPADLAWSKAVLAAFTARVKDGKATDVKRIARGKRPRKLSRGHVILAFRVNIDKFNSWYNGYTYLDTMNHDAVKEFIRVTHRAYRKSCGEHFGKRVPGIFTDEPNYGHGRGLPWTGKLPLVFRKRYGYDVLDHLPELIFEVDGKTITKSRRDYRDCITHLFVDAFAKQIGDWCERNNMQHTGHVLMEETLNSQTRVVGAAMRFYEYMQAPGMDLLTEHSREISTAKQVSSVANQFDRKWRLTETYGCTGWDFGFAGHKALGDWQAAMGINLRCQHLSWYTMLGSAKRDYPAGIFYQSPWWELYGKVEDYFARIHAVMTRGREVRDILVLHPIESVWATSSLQGGTTEENQQIEEAFARLRDSLLVANLDFDYGDEDILARHGKVSRVAGGARLKVAKATYNTVVVPPMLTMRGSTLTLLKRFRKAGGTVVFAGTPSPRVDMELSDAVTDFAAACTTAPEKGVRLAAAAEAGRVVTICDGNGKQLPSTLYLLREDRDAAYLFVINTGHTAAEMQAGGPECLVRDRKVACADVRISVNLPCPGKPLELNPDTGETCGTEAKRKGSGWEIRTELPPIGSRLYVLPKKASRKALPVPGKARVLKKQKLAPKSWNIALSEDNVLVLDQAKFRIAGESWQKKTEILQIDHAVRDSLGIAHRGGQMVQPWAQKRSATPKRTAVELVYSFDVNAVPSGSCFLALERPETFQIEVNGQALSMDAECGWWCDRSLRKIPLDTALLQKGRNQFRLTCDYDEAHSGLEIVYLLGNFGTRVKGAEATVTAAPSSLRLGDWGSQGLAFYSGSVRYLRTVNPKLRKGERLFVSVPDYRGVAVRVLVDGKPAGIIAWEPNEIEITDLVGSGPAELAIELISHRRNSHGPLHLTEKWPRWTGPGQFEKNGGREWQDDYQLVPCGLMKPPILEVRK